MSKERCRGSRTQQLKLDGRRLRDPGFRCPGVDRWLVDRSHAIAPPSDGDFDAAYLVRLSRGSTRGEVVVEFAAPSAVTSVGYAEEVVRRFQRDAELPQHLIVECDGSVRTLTGARERDPGEAAQSISEDTTQSHDPQRARNHRRG